MDQSNKQSAAVEAAAARLGLHVPAKAEAKVEHLEHPAAVTPVPSGMSMPEMLAQMQQIVDMNQKLSARLLAAGIPLEDAPDAPRAKKMYYHRIPNSTIVVVRKDASGSSIPEVHTFYGGQLETDDPVLQDFLDPICDKNGSPVFSKDRRGEQTPEALKAAAEVVQAAARTIDKLGAEARPPV